GCRRVHAEDVLGHVHAHAADHAEPTGVASKYVGHGGDRVGHVIAAGPAREGQAAGDGDRALVVVGEAERVACKQHRAGEAAVQVEVGEIVDGDPGPLEGDGAGGGHRGRPPHLVALGQVPGVVAVGPAPQVHAPVRGN